MVKKDVQAQTWDDNGEDVVHLVAHWMIVECVAANLGWTTLDASSGLVARGMEMVKAVAAYRGIHAGHVVVTPGDLLAALKDVAVELNAPAASMPMWEPAPPGGWPGINPSDPAQNQIPETDAKA